MIVAHIPPRPGEPFEPRHPDWQPPVPGQPSPGEPSPGQPFSQPVRIWTDPNLEWQQKLQDQLLARRMILVSGVLDDPAAARLSAQLLALDADNTAPVRMELQNLHADLQPVITVMGILDMMHAPVHACVSGEVTGPALGLLASCPHRTARPNATVILSEPRMQLAGTTTMISAREQQIQRMLDTLYFRLSEVTGRPADEIREDARSGRVLTSAQAVGYGLIQAQESGPR